MKCYEVGNASLVIFSCMYVSKKPPDDTVTPPNSTMLIVLINDQYVEYNKGGITAWFGMCLQTANVKIS